MNEIGALLHIILYIVGLAHKACMLLFVLAAVFFGWLDYPVVIMFYLFGWAFVFDVFSNILFALGKEINKNVPQ